MMVGVYGRTKVGLLTGDTSIGSEADIVVATTGAAQHALRAFHHAEHLLRYVILDEVHYLADRFPRARVGRKSSSTCPRPVKIVGLSPTVSNVEDFPAGLPRCEATPQTGDRRTHRPVPLEQHIIVQADEHRSLGCWISIA